MKKLKPCPFCGGEVNVSFTSMTYVFLFAHKDERLDKQCPLAYEIAFDGTKIKSLAEAREAWNRRADVELPEGETTDNKLKIAAALLWNRRANDE